MLRVILLGKSKAGKSEVGNNLLGDDVFSKQMTKKPMTWATRGEMEVFETKSLGEIDFEVMTTLSNELKGISGGVNTFALIMNVNECKLDTSLVNSLHIWESFLSKNFWNHVCVVFTHCDEDSENEWGMKVQRCKEISKTIGRKFDVAAPRAFFVSTKHNVGEWSNFINFIKSKSQFHCPNLYSSPAKKRRTHNQCHKKKQPLTRWNPTTFPFPTKFQLKIHQRFRG